LRIWAIFDRRAGNHNLVQVLEQKRAKNSRFSASIFRSRVKTARVDLYTTLNNAHGHPETRRADVIPRPPGDAAVSVKMGFASFRDKISLPTSRGCSPKFIPPPFSALMLTKSRSR
jgi:hypothetical protein